MSHTLLTTLFIFCIGCESKQPFAPPPQEAAITQPGSVPTAPPPESPSSSSEEPSKPLRREEDSSSVVFATNQLMYVDCENGADSNSGFAQEKPVKTIHKALESIANIDGLFFRRGSSCFEPITIDLSSNARTGDFTIGVYGDGSNPAYLFSTRPKPLNWSLAKNLAINGKSVSYLAGTPIYVADLTYKATQLLDNRLNRLTQSRHPNNDWEFLGGVLQVSEGDNWFSLTINNIPAFSDYGVTKNETVLYRLNNWHVQKFPVWNYSQQTNRVELAKSVEPIYRDTAKPNYGYRIQNSLAALDSAGEWYQDFSTGKIYFWAPSNDKPSENFLLPNDIDVLSVSNGNRAVSIHDISIIGSGRNGISIMQVPSAFIEGISVYAANENGIATWKVPNLTIKNSTVKDSNANGIIVNDSVTVEITKNSITNNGRLGTQKDIAQQLNGITIGSVKTSTTIEENVIDSSGYAGISLAVLEGTAEISRNSVSNSCLFLNDCGGIYLNGIDVTATIRIAENTVSDSHGNQSGGGGEGDMATGIYLDWVVNNTKIEKNTLWNTDNHFHGSIFIHGGSFNTITDNIITVSSPNIGGIQTHTEAITGSVPHNNTFERNTCHFPSGTSGECVLHR